MPIGRFVLPTPMIAFAADPAPEADEPSQEETEEPEGLEEEDGASEEPAEEASGEPEETASPSAGEDLGMYDISGALGGAAVVDITSRSDADAPLWSGETEHTGAEITQYYALDLEQTELRWQRWWSDASHTESVTAEEFENARAFYRDSMPGFTEGLTVYGCDAFFFDLYGDASLLWYDAGRDLIFQVTAYAGNSAAGAGMEGTDSAGLGTLLSLAESLAG